VRKLLYFVTHLLLVGCASAAFAVTVPDGFIVYKVGGSADCPYHTIQDAVDAAAQHPGIDLVWIAMDQIYTDQHVVVTDQDVNIQGGFTDCEDIDPSLDQTIINGMSGHSVFEIEGTSNVYMSNLFITGADMNEDHSGGGIYFGGNGSLTTYAVWVFNNRAGYGGGIDVSPSGPTIVNLEQTVVSLNTALVSGGGIRVEGETTLNILHTPNDADSFITTNTAQGSDGIGYGGGIEVLGPAVANISAIVDVNTAAYGGGIAALGTANGSALVTLFTGDANAPVAIYGNTASNTGGGIFLKSHADSLHNAKVCAQDFAIDQNTAANGAAIYMDEDNSFGSIAFLNAAVCDQPSGAVACAAGVPCNEINNNIATAGATVLVQSGGAFYGNRFAARGNQSNELFWFLADTDTDADLGGNFMDLHNCLLAQNSIGDDLVLAGFIDSVHQGTEVTIDTCTIAGNTYAPPTPPFGTPPVILAATNFLSVTNAIVDDRSRPPLFNAGAPPGDATFRYDLTSDAAAFVGGTGISEAEPLFVDAANGDFHLLRTSPGVDFAPEVDGIDLDGNPRTVDLTDIDNGGPEDVGAYEIQSQLDLPDEIFGAGFEP
jgi:hypothetical protein